MLRDQGKSGISIVAVRYLAKVMAPVRFRYPAHIKRVTDIIGRLREP